MRFVYNMRSREGRQTIWKKSTQPRRKARFLKEGSPLVALELESSDHPSLGRVELTSALVRPSAGGELQGLGRRGRVRKELGLHERCVRAGLRSVRLLEATGTEKGQVREE